MGSSLMNLCDPVFETVISCNTVSSEGYEVTNLLSDVSEKRKSGFMCDRFIKPPVEITLKFPFDVNIRYIQIGTVVGQQKSSGLEIQSSSSPYNSSQCSGSSSSKKQPTSGLPGSPTVEKIASVLLNDSERGVVLYCPLQYGRRSPNPVPSTKVNFVQRAMMWRSRLVIAHTSSLTIRIFRTYGSSVPALDTIEVWGAPSSCMPAHLVADVVGRWNKAHEEKATEVEDISKGKVSSLSPCKQFEESVLSDIPEEFLDAITWEIMALPMVLPSGKVVDQQTLDLHAQAEANWGRHPSDPFTGLMFSEGCRPILDSALKSRIDRFLVLNQDRRDLRAVPRTVGRSQPQSHQTVSRFRSSQLCLDSTAPNRKRTALDLKSVASSSAILQAGRSTSVLKPQCTQEQNNSLPSFSRVPVTAIPYHESKRLKVTSVSLTESKQDDGCIIIDEDDKGTTDDLRNHEKKLDDSLDSALKAALSHLPSFVNPPKILVNDCGSCKAVERLYRLPCFHFLCRPCLVGRSKESPQRCLTCSKEFKSCDPVAYHE